MFLLNACIGMWSPYESSMSSEEDYEGNFAAPAPPTPAPGPPPPPMKAMAPPPVKKRLRKSSRYHACIGCSIVAIRKLHMV